MERDVAWEQAARQLPPTQPAQEQSNPTHRGSIAMFGGLTMCELSVDDERDSKVDQMTVTKNWHDSWSNWDGTLVSERDDE